MECCFVHKNCTCSGKFRWLFIVNILQPRRRSVFLAGKQAYFFLVGMDTVILGVFRVWGYTTCLKNFLNAVLCFSFIILLTCSLILAPLLLFVLPIRILCSQFTSVTFTSCTSHCLSFYLLSRLFIINFLDVYVWANFHISVAQCISSTVGEQRVINKKILYVRYCGNI